jgi:hypothetical protein
MAFTNCEWHSQNPDCEWDRPPPALISDENRPEFASGTYPRAPDLLPKLGRPAARKLDKSSESVRHTPQLTSKKNQPTGPNSSASTSLPAKPMNSRRSSSTSLDSRSTTIGC